MRRIIEVSWCLSTCPCNCVQVTIQVVHLPYFLYWNQSRDPDTLMGNGLGMLIGTCMDQPISLTEVSVHDFIYYSKLHTINSKVRLSSQWPRTWFVPGAWLSEGCSIKMLTYNKHVSPTQLAWLRLPSTHHFRVSFEPKRMGFHVRNSPGV